MEQIEEWRPVKGLEGFYEVSDCGNVRSLDRNVLIRNGRRRHYRGVLLRSVVSKKGYLVVNIKGRLRYVHQLVASAFLPNARQFTEVNHIDENPLNNNVNNLEWCSHKYNSTFGTARSRMIEKRYLQKSFGEKEIVMLSEDGEVINIFRSSKVAMNATGIASSSICDCCRGYRRKTAGGYRWMFKKDYDNRNARTTEEEKP